MMNNNLGTNAALGLHAGTKLAPSFGLGFYGTYESLGTGVGTVGTAAVTASASETILAAEANYFPMNDNGLYLGVKLGLGMTSASATATSVTTGASASGSSSSTNLAVGPGLGYNYAIGNGWGAGLDLSYLTITTSGSSLNTFHSLATINYMF